MKTSLLGIALLLAGCSAQSSTNTLGVCDNRTQGGASVIGQCRHWTGASTGDFQSLCTSQNGTFSQNPCATDSQVGKCVTDQGYGLFLDYYYYSPQFTSGTAETNCKALASCQFSCVFTPLP